MGRLYGSPYLCPLMAAIPPGVKFMLISTAGFAMLNLCAKGLPRIPAHEMVSFRVIVSLAIIGVIAWRNRINILGTNRFWLLVRGAAGAIAVWLYFLTIKHMPLATAVAVQYLSPLFSAVLAPFFVKERMTAVQWVYFMISFIGVVCLKGFDLSISPFYLFLGLFSAFLTGVSVNAIRKSRATEHPLVVMAYLPLFAIPISVPITILDWTTPIGWEWALLFLTGIFTLVNQYYTTRALQMDRIERVTYLNYLGLVYAVIFGYFFFDEHVSLGSFGALCLIVGGVLLNFLHGLRQVRRFRLHYAYQMRRHYRRIRGYGFSQETQSP